MILQGPFSRSENQILARASSVGLSKMISTKLVLEDLTDDDLDMISVRPEEALLQILKTLSTANKSKRLSLGRSILILQPRELN